MNREELEKAIQQNGSASAVLLAEVLKHLSDMSFAVVGDLANLETDHKSNIVEAINELFGVLETPELEVSMTQTNAQRKVIYDECAKHPPLAKNIVFYNMSDAMYYRVNGYNLVNNVLHLHAIMQGEGGTLRSVVVQIGSNGTISVV